MSKVNTIAARGYGWFNWLLVIGMGFSVLVIFPSDVAATWGCENIAIVVDADGTCEGNQDGSMDGAGGCVGTFVISAHDDACKGGSNCDSTGYDPCVQDNRGCVGDVVIAIGGCTGGAESGSHGCMGEAILSIGVGPEIEWPFGYSPCTASEGETCDSSSSSPCVDGGNGGSGCVGGVVGVVVSVGEQGCSGGDGGDSADGDGGHGGHGCHGTLVINLGSGCRAGNGGNGDTGGGDGGDGCSGTIVVDPQNGCEGGSGGTATNPEEDGTDGEDCNADIELCGI